MTVKLTLARLASSYDPKSLIVCLSVGNAGGTVEAQTGTTTYARAPEIRIF